MPTLASGNWTNSSHRVICGPLASESLGPEVIFKIFNNRKGKDLLSSELTALMIREAHPMQGFNPVISEPWQIWERSA